MCPRSALAILADNITLDLKGHTVTYDSEVTPTFTNADFESQGGPRSISGWDLSGAPQAQGFSGEFLKGQVFSGTHSVLFPKDSANQQVTSTSVVQLQPNTKYLISAMISDNAVGNQTNPTKFIELIPESGNQTAVARAEFSPPVWRPMQWMRAIFTTPASVTPLRYKIRFGIVGKAISPVYFDYVSIRGDTHFGVSVARYEEAIRWKSAKNSRITSSAPGGKIIQGAGASSHSHAIPIEENRAPGLTIENVTISASGPNTRNIVGSSPTVTVKNNILYNSTRQIFSRDDLDGYPVYFLSPGGTFTGNTLIGGIQGGIFASGNAATPRITISNNYISTNSFYTNGFGIMVNYANVTGNTVENLGVRAPGATRAVDTPCPNVMSQTCGSGRGIAGRNMNATNNVVRVRELPRNVEYAGCQLGGAYGMQLESSDNVIFENNQVTAFAKECDGVGLRINVYTVAGGNRNIKVRKNIFEARDEGGTGFGNVIKLTNIDDGRLIGTVEENTFKSNDRFVEGMDIHTVPLYRNTFIDTGMPAGISPFSAYNWDRTVKHSVQDLSFIDSIFGTNARSRFENFSFLLGVGPELDKLSSFNLAWTVNVTVTDAAQKPQINRSVTFTTKQGTVAATAVTDAAGKVSVVLHEVRDVGGVKTASAPYTISVDGKSTTVAVNQPTNVTIVVGGSSPPTITPTRTPIPPITPTSTSVPPKTSTPTNTPEVTPSSTATATGNPTRTPVVTVSPTKTSVPTSTAHVAGGFSLQTVGEITKSTFAEATALGPNDWLTGRVGSSKDASYPFVIKIGDPRVPSNQLDGAITLLDVNGNGEAVGFGNTTKERHGVHVTANAEVLNLSKNSTATSINGSGAVILCRQPRAAGRCRSSSLITSPEGRSTVKTIGDTHTKFSDLTENGLRVGTYFNRGSKPFVMRRTLSILPALGARRPARGSALAANDSGLIVGTVTNRGTEVAVAWRQVKGRWRAVRLFAAKLGYRASAALGVNAAGDIVGTFADAHNDHQGYLLKANGALTTFESFSAQGFSISEISHINDSGTMLGRATLSSGESVSVVLRP